jgi:MYXO-CTERM domain-containing protein
MCGNGVREGNEGCDGTDWLLTRCDDLPIYSGGTLTCDQSTCVFDTTQCTMPGVDTTAGTTPSGGDSSISTTADTATGSTGQVGAEDGCGCRAGGSSAGWLLALFSFGMLGATRQRRVS